MVKMVSCIKYYSFYGDCKFTHIYFIVYDLSILKRTNSNLSGQSTDVLNHPNNKTHQPAGWCALLFGWPAGSHSGGGHPLEEAVGRPQKFWCVVSKRALSPSVSSGWYLHQLTPGWRVSFLEIMKKFSRNYLQFFDGYVILFQSNIDSRNL